MFLIYLRKVFGENGLWFPFVQFIYFCYWQIFGRWVRATVWQWFRFNNLYYLFMYLLYYMWLAGHGWLMPQRNICLKQYYIVI